MKGGRVIVNEEPRDVVSRRERCTTEESAATLADHGRPAIEWRYYADRSVGMLLGPEVKR